MFTPSAARIKCVIWVFFLSYMYNHLLHGLYFKLLKFKLLLSIKYKCKLCVISIYLFTVHLITSVAQIIVLNDELEDDSGLF
jgi:hypothetical protein